MLYIESFGNPRKFARTARRVAAKMPVLTVQAGRSAAGQRAAASHTAAVATPLVSRQALFEQAGIIATPTLGELIETTALLASQPVPAGSTVAIVSNVGGAGVLAADVSTELGLTVHRPHGMTHDGLRQLVPDSGAVDGPVDTTATVSAETFRQVLELTAADEEVDAVIALVLPTAATGNLVAAVQQADVRVPLAAVLLDQAESVRLLPRAEGQVPCYGYPEAAAAALARAARYGAWRAGPRGLMPEFSDIRADDARALMREFLHGPARAAGCRDNRGTAALLRHSAGRANAGEQRGRGRPRLRDRGRPRGAQGRRTGARPQNGRGRRRTGPAGRSRRAGGLPAADGTLRRQAAPSPGPADDRRRHRGDSGRGG